MAKTLSDVEVKKQIEILDELEDAVEDTHFNYWWLTAIPAALAAAASAYFVLRRWLH